VLVIAFTCNHCPTAQLYESRIKQLAADYKDRGVTLVAIEPNNPNAVRLDEMGYTDVGDSFDDMKTRAGYRKFNFPYLYDGETQKVSHAYGPSATPHLFIFDKDRKLRYEGRVDNNPREPLVTVKDARNAIEALLSNQTVKVPKTPSVGCSTKWLYKEEGRKEELAEIESKPVDVKPASADDLKALRKNSTGKLVLVNFWATWCGPCKIEIPWFIEFQEKYGKSGLNIIGILTEDTIAKAKPFAAEWKMNYTLLSGIDRDDLDDAYGPMFGLPVTILISRDGKICAKHVGLSSKDAFEKEIKALL
jgi:thiol-disulfide isomerase/thioredoxin